MSVLEVDSDIEDSSWRNMDGSDLEPLAQVERKLLVVEVLHLPHPELGGLLRGGEHFDDDCFYYFQK